MPVPEEPASPPASQPADTRRREGAARPVGMGPPRPALLLLLLAVAGAWAREWRGPACGPRGPGFRGGGGAGKEARGARPAVARPRTARRAGTAQAGEGVRSSKSAKTPAVPLRGRPGAPSEDGRREKPTAVFVLSLQKRRCRKMSAPAAQVRRFPSGPGRAPPTPSPSFCTSAH